eukprot:scaffold248625_cov76-Cyclotella_meneghiniana.AAC.1
MDITDQPSPSPPKRKDPPELSILTKPPSPPAKKQRINRELAHLQKAYNKLFSKKRPAKIATFELPQQLEIHPSKSLSIPVSKDDIAKVAAMERPIPPITLDMLSFQTRLTTTQTRLNSQLHDVSTNYSMGDNIFQILDDIGEALTGIADMMQQLDIFLNETRRNVDLVQSVQDKAKEMAEASRKEPAQLILWTKILTKTNLILKLVRKENEKQQQLQQQQGENEEHLKISAENDNHALPRMNDIDETSPDYIPLDKFRIQLLGGARSSHPPLDNHTLEWADGKVYCKCCNNTRVRYLKNMYRHTLLDSHKTNLEKLKGKKDYITFERFIAQLNGGARGSHPSLEGHTLAWGSSGKVYCIACDNKELGHLKNLSRHVLNENHRKNLEIWREENGAVVQDNNDDAGVNSRDSAPTNFSAVLEAIRESKSKHVKIKDSTKVAVNPNYITYEKFIKTLNGGARKAHPPIHNHSFEWSEGQVHCICCGYVHIAQLKNLYRHTLLESHIKNLGLASGRSNFPIYQLETETCNTSEEADTELALGKYETSLDAFDEKYITYERFMARLSGGGSNSHPSIHNQSFEWSDGKVFCIACKYQRITHLKNLFRHTEQKGHKKNLLALSAKVPFHQGDLEDDTDEIQKFDPADHNIDTHHKIAMDANNDAAVIKKAAEEETVITDQPTDSADITDLSDSLLQTPAPIDDEQKPAACNRSITELTVVTEKEYISHAKFITQLNGGARDSHPPIRNHTLEWSRGVVYCKCCGNQRIRQLKNLFRHTQIASHVRALKLAQERGEIIPSGVTPVLLDETDKDYISHQKFLNQLDGGSRNAHAAIHNQALEWKGGVIYCKCCGNQRIRQLKNLFRHTQSDAHKENLAHLNDTRLSHNEAEDNSKLPSIV